MCMLQFLVLRAEAQSPPALCDMRQFIAIPLLLYLLLIRPGKNKEKERPAVLPGPSSATRSGSLLVMRALCIIRDEPARMQHVYEHG